MVFHRRVLIVGLMLSLLPTCSASTMTFDVELFQPQFTYFNVTINCSPSQPVKSFELKLEFDPDIMQAISVEEGDFFDGFYTFFNPGIIDNDQGRIINVYDLIIGPGPGNITTEPGSLVKIRFMTKGQEGRTVLDVYDEGINNESQYIPLTVHEKWVQVYDTYYPWDIDEDRVINYIDTSMVVGHYQESFTPGQYPWDAIEDGIVNYADISIVCYHYGETY